MGSEIESRMGNANAKKFGPSSNVDDAVLENLSNLISSLKAQVDSKDFQPLIQFFQKGYVSQVVQVWSYYAQVNDHPKFSKATTLLVNTLSLLGSDQNVYEHGSLLINLILSGHIRVLYRGLNGIRASLTNPTLRLMKEMILFNSNEHIENFISSFDFSLSSLVKILNVNKADFPASVDEVSKSPRLSMRVEFLNFWLTLITFCAPLPRRQLMIDNSRIMGAWLKLMDKLDPPTLMIRTLDMFMDKILNEGSYKRTTKCKILNELALSKIHSFYHSPDKALVRKVNDFFLDYGYNKNSNVAFPDDAVWFEESPLSGTHKGAEVIINQRSFKLYNKLLFNVLKFFKPWEDDMQANTLIKILDHVPELVAPYCTFLASHGTHDPKMTSYWFGSTLILGRIIRLKIPHFMEQVETDATPSIPLVMESILPSPLSRLAMSKALQHERLVIRQLACHLIVFAFQKFELVMELFETKGWSSAKTTLRNAFYHSIPDLSTISSAMNQSYNSCKTNKILQLSFSTILKYYSTAFPNFFSIKLPSSNIFVDIMRSDNFSGIEFGLLNNFLHFQELSGLQTKWWIGSSQERSIFVSLLDVARTAPLSLREKICQLLEDMFRGSVAFNKLLCSPQRALVHSLHLASAEASEADMIKIWKFLNETVQRCLKTPYKYVDMAASHCRVSPFIMALFEQWKFVERDTEFDLSTRWFCLYLRTMIVCGEPEEGIKSGVKTYLPAICDEYIDFYLHSSGNSKLFPDSDTFRSNIMQSSFLELIVLSPYAELKKIVRHPVSQLDATGLLYRVISLINDSMIERDTQFSKITEDLTDMLESYAMTDHSLPLLKYFESLLMQVGNTSELGNVAEKSLLVAHLVARVIQGIGSQVTDLGHLVLTWLQSNEQLLRVAGEENQFLISSLFTCLTTDHSIHLLEKNQEMNIFLLRQLLKCLSNENGVSIPYSAVKPLLIEASTASLDLASGFISQNRVNGFAAEEFLSLVLTSDSYSTVMDSYLKSNYFVVDHLLPFLPQIKEPKLSLLVAGAMINSKDEHAQAFLQKVGRESYSSLKNYDLESSEMALTLFISSSDLLTVQSRNDLVDYLINDYNGKYSAAATKYLVTVGDFENPGTLRWLNKMMLYITKNLFSSSAVKPDLVNALKNLRQLPENVWQRINQKNLNSQLEALLSGDQVCHVEVLEYALHVCLSGRKGDIQCGKLMQCLLNNEAKNKEVESYVKYLTAAIIYVLYLGDPAECTNVTIQEHLLMSYEGTVSGKDRLIFAILNLIEARTSRSWTDGIYTWDLLDAAENEQEGLQLISKQKEGLVLTLNRQTIRNSAVKFAPNRPNLPHPKQVNVKGFAESLVLFYEQTESIVPESALEAYDPLFLLLSSIQNEDLVKSSKSEDGALKYTFNVKAFLSSNIFQVIICSLGGEAELQAVALALIKGMLSSLQENEHLKDLRPVEFLLSRIVYTFGATEASNEDKFHSISPCIWFAISQLSIELTQPASQLHEKAFRWVLSSPIIHQNDIPMLQELMHPKANMAEQGLFYKQLGWVLNCLEHGLKTEQDVEQMKRMGVLEWLSNLRSLPYINGKMRSSITAIFYACQRTGNSGLSLITRVASISSSELQALSFDHKTSKAEQEMNRNEKNMRHLQRLLTLQQQKLNTEEVLAGDLVLINSNKRLRDWTEDDCENIRKRMIK